jgi:hypothetical protein
VDWSVDALMGSGATPARFVGCGVILTIDATLPLATALANGRDAEPVTGSRERRLGSFA